MTMLVLLIQQEFLYQSVDKKCLLQCSLKYSTFLKSSKCVTCRTTSAHCALFIKGCLYRLKKQILHVSFNLPGLIQPNFVFSVTLVSK